MDETYQHNLNAYLQRLRRLDCCAVSDALDRLKLAGVVSGLLQRSAPGRIAGRSPEHYNTGHFRTSISIWHGNLRSTSGQ